MKKFFIIGLIAVLSLSGCGKSGSSAGAPSSEFFAEKIEGEITVSVYDSVFYKAFLEEAAAAFEARYPGTKVNIETFSGLPEIIEMEGGGAMSIVRNDPQSQADYISRASARLMSGQGADIYAMDVLPLHKYIESGVLENLDHYMETDPAFNKNDYRQNIMDAIRYKDGTWFLPLDYMFYYYAYDPALVPAEAAKGLGVNAALTADGLINTGIPFYNGGNKLFNLTDYSLMNYSPYGGSIFNMLLTQNLHEFIDMETGKTNFADGKFAAILEKVRYYGEQGYVAKGVKTEQQLEEMYNTAFSNDDQDNKYFFKRENSFSLFFQFAEKQGIGAVMDMGVSGNDLIAGIEANADGTVPFRYTQGFSMNSRSKNKTAAWAFLKFLLSHEMQLSLNLGVVSLPVNNGAREEKSELVFSGALFGIDHLPYDKEKLENYKTAMEGLSGKINYFSVRDSSLNEMIMQEAAYFFNGIRSAEEVSRIIQNKADLYLSE